MRILLLNVLQFKSLPNASNATMMKCIQFRGLLLCYDYDKNTCYASPSMSLQHTAPSPLCCDGRHGLPRALDWRPTQPLPTSRKQLRTTPQYAMGYP
jgi:hypothetical protein